MELLGALLGTGKPKKKKKKKGHLRPLPQSRPYDHESWLDDNDCENGDGDPIVDATAATTAIAAAATAASSLSSLLAQAAPAEEAEEKEAAAADVSGAVPTEDGQERKGKRKKEKTPAWFKAVRRANRRFIKYGPDDEDRAGMSDLRAELPLVEETKDISDYDGDGDDQTSMPVALSVIDVSLGGDDEDGEPTHRDPETWAIGRGGDEDADGGGEAKDPPPRRGRRKRARRADDGAAAVASSPPAAAPAGGLGLLFGGGGGDGGRGRGGGGDDYDNDDHNWIPAPLPGYSTDDLYNALSTDEMLTEEASNRKAVDWCYLCWVSPPRPNSPQYAPHHQLLNMIAKEFHTQSRSTFVRRIARFYRRTVKAFIDEREDDRDQHWSLRSIDAHLRGQHAPTVRLKMENAIFEIGLVRRFMMHGGLVVRHCVTGDVAMDFRALDRWMKLLDRELKFVKEVTPLRASSIV